MNISALQRNILYLFALLTVGVLSYSAFAGNLHLEACLTDLFYYDNSYSHWGALSSLKHNAYRPWCIFNLGISSNKLLILFNGLNLFLIIISLSAIFFSFWRSHLSALAASICFLAAYLSIFQLDIVTSSFLAALCISSLFFFIDTSPLSLSTKTVCALIVGLLCGLVAHQTAPYALLSGATAAWLLQIRSIRFPVFLLLIATAGTLVALYGYRLIPFPDYPYFAQVVPDSGASQFPSPVFGFSWPVPVIDRTALKETLLLPGMFIFLFSLIAWIVQRSSRIAALALALSFFLLLDTIAAESIAQILPVATLQRIAPDLFLIEVPYLVFAATFFILSLSLLSANRIFLTLLLFSLLANGSLSPFCSSQQKLMAGLTKQHHSPSLQIVQKLGAITDLPESDLKARRMRKSIASIRSSYPIKKLLWKLMDKSAKTRWSPENGVQSGGEWLEIRFREPVSISGLELSPGSFRTDYPAGLKIEYAKNCEEMEGPGIRQKGLSLLKKIEPWRGMLELTADGYPYYGRKSNVRIPFSESVELQCLVITQTGKRNFDWSIAELRFLVSKSPDNLLNPHNTGG